MEFSYFERAIASATRVERKLLLKFLRDPKTKDVRDSVEENALILEAKSWKIAFYSQDDIRDAIEYLRETSENLILA